MKPILIKNNNYKNYMNKAKYNLEIVMAERIKTKNVKEIKVIKDIANVDLNHLFILISDSIECLYNCHMLRINGNKDIIIKDTSHNIREHMKNLIKKNKEYGNCEKLFGKSLYLPDNNEYNKRRFSFERFNDTNDYIESMLFVANYLYKTLEHDFNMEFVTDFLKLSDESKLLYFADI